MLAAVRDARQEEAGAIADLLSRAAFGPTVSRLVAFPRTSPHGDVLVAENGDGAAAGAVCCVSFGATGWIGALGVAPEARRHGLGRALTEAAIARLHERGASTVLLSATAIGRAPATLVIPDANAAAMANLRRWGFRAANAGERMRLGPPVAWRPERQFGLFNLFWG